MLTLYRLAVFLTAAALFVALWVYDPQVLLWLFDGNLWLIKRMKAFLPLDYAARAEVIARAVSAEKIMSFSEVTFAIGYLIRLAWGSVSLTKPPRQ